MNSIRAAGVVGLALALSLPSCVQLGAEQPVGGRDVRRLAEPVPRVRAEMLENYASGLRLLDPAERLGECFRASGKYAKARTVQALLTFFLAQLSAPGCGDIRVTALAVKGLEPRYFDSATQRFVNFQLVLADRIQLETSDREELLSTLERVRANLRLALSRHRQSVSQARLTYRQMISRDAEARQLKQKVDQLKSVEQGLSQSVRSRDAEARDLKEKLEALKSIEQEMNETERREDYEQP